MTNNAAFLDAMQRQFSVKNDAQLARKLSVAPPQLSKIRNGKLPVGSSLVLKCHELGGVPVSDIRALIGGLP